MEKTRTKPAKSKLKKPSRFQVFLLNDDYTTMEFVIQVLQQFFDKTEESAYAIMLKVHIDGEGVHIKMLGPANVCWVFLGFFL
jgi:ATP-dependent Clp protease adaptor protein ClpS